MKFPDRFFEQRTKVTLALLLPAILVYYKSIHYGFTTLDEQWLILKNETLKHGRRAFSEALTNSISGMYYRPVLMLSFLADYSVGRLSPGIYHFTNLVLHLGCVLLLFRFLKLNKVPPPTAFVFSLIFSVHPIMLHSVAWIPGRNDLLLCVFSLASLNHLLRYYEQPRRSFLLFHLLFFVCALFTKESAIGLPLLFAGYYFIFKKERTQKALVKLLALWLALGICWFLFRSRTVYIAPGDVVVSANALREFFPAMLLYAGKAILPVQQSVLPMLRDASLVPGWLALALLVVLAVKPGIKDKKLAGMGLLMFFTLLAIPVWFSVAKSGAEHYEHRIYTSMAGMMLFFACLNFNTASRNFYYAAGLLIILFAARSYVRMDVYKNEELFLRAGVKESPGFYLFHFQLGDNFAGRGRNDSALLCYNTAIALRPDKSMMHSNRGSALYALGRYQEAIADYSEAIKHSPALDYRFHLNRCVASVKFNQYEQAMKDLVILKSCCQPQIPANLEAAVTDRWQRIMEGMTRRVSADPKNPALFYRRATLLFTSGWEKEGLDDLRTACALAPDNARYKKALEEHLKTASVAELKPH